MSAAGSLLDVSIEVASDGYIIFSAKTSANVSKVYSNYKICNELLFKIFDKEYYFVVITDNEWSILRDEYINNIKNGVKYGVKEMVSNLKIEDTFQNEPTIVDKLFDLVGEENVEFK